MSDAELADLEGYLQHQKSELAETIVNRREQNLAFHSAKGTLQSGAAMKGGITSLDETMRSHIRSMEEGITNWPGANLDEADVRRAVAAHLYTAIDTFFVPQYAYRLGTRGVHAGSEQALSSLIDNLIPRMKAEVRRIELGASKPKGMPMTSNIVKAHTIAGGVQQGGEFAVQISNVEINNAAVAATIKALLAAIEEDSMREAIEPEIATIQAQLKKDKPSASILAEAGKSVRSIIEGALGGAVGGTMTPQLAQALAAFATAVGIG